MLGPLPTNRDTQPETRAPARVPGCYYVARTSISSSIDQAPPPSTVTLT